MIQTRPSKPRSRRLNEKRPSDDESFAEAVYAADRRTTVVAGGRWGGEASVFESTGDALHIAEHDPARVLRAVAGKRRTLVRCEEEMMAGIPRLTHFAQKTLREVAEEYSHRDGYTEAVAGAD